MRQELDASKESIQIVEQNYSPEDSWSSHKAKRIALLNPDLEGAGSSLSRSPPSRNMVNLPSLNATILPSLNQSQ